MTKFEQKFELHLQRRKVEEAQNWRKDIDIIPFITFKPDWKVKVIPPFGDALVRFLVELPNGVEKSIYLDSRESLGFWENANPYWEVYPVNDDTGRCDIDDIKTLLELIET